MRCERNDLIGSSGEEWITSNEERFCPPFDHRRKGGLYLSQVAGADDHDLLPDVACHRLDLSHFGVGSLVGRIDKQRDARGLWNELAQQLQSLCSQVCSEESHASDVSPGAVHARHQALAYRIASVREYDRKGRGCCFRHQRGIRGSGYIDYGRRKVNQFCYQLGQPFVLLRCTQDDRQVPTFGEAGLSKTST